MLITTELLKSKYFIFQSNPQINAHLFLYNAAMVAKFKKVNRDSISNFTFKDKQKTISPEDHKLLNTILIFYIDSLLTKDLLLDPSMREFTDKLVNFEVSSEIWQLSTLNHLKIFEPYYLKYCWPSIAAKNIKWINENKAQILKLESSLIPIFEKIYEIKLPEKKVMVSMSSYAGWSGSYSYINSFNHIILASDHFSNQKEQGIESLFHETSHFLSGQLSAEIKLALGNRETVSTINLWHNLLYYTTGTLLEKDYATQQQVFIPYYQRMKLEAQVPEFKKELQAMKLFWDEHLEGRSSLSEVVPKIVKSVLEQK